MSLGGLFLVGILVSIYLIVVEIKYNSKESRYIRSGPHDSGPVLSHLFNLQQARNELPSPPALAIIVSTDDCALRSKGEPWAPADDSHRGQAFGAVAHHGGEQELVTPVRQLPPGSGVT